VLAARSVYMAIAIDRRPEIWQRLADRVLPFYLAHREDRDIEVLVRDRAGEFVDDTFVHTDPPRPGDPVPLSGWEYAMMCWLDWSGLSRVTWEPYEQGPDEFGMWVFDQLPIVLAGWRAGMEVPPWPRLLPTDEPDRGWSEREAAERGLAETPKLEGRSDRGGNPTRRLEWTVERLVLGRSTAAIARSHHLTPRAVRRAVQDMCDLLGIGRAPGSEA
jgi:hypothetical protein